MTSPRPLTEPEKDLEKDTEKEPCLRCGAGMEWRHQTLQCPRCRFKIGCCEGATGDCTGS